MGEGGRWEGLRGREEAEGSSLRWRGREMEGGREGDGGNLSSGREEGREGVREKG